MEKEVWREKVWNGRAGTWEEVQASDEAREQGLPFDPRKEVSADAKHITGRIVTHLWIIFVLLPMVLAILYFLLK